MSCLCDYKLLPIRAPTKNSVFGDLWRDRYYGGDCRKDVENLYLESDSGDHWAGYTTS